MQGILFSVTDLSLIATILECALMFYLIAMTRTIPVPSLLCRCSLSLFFIAIALDSVAMLLIWHDGIREALIAFSPITLTLATLALTAKGPLLYIFIKTISQPNFTLKPIHLLHTLPFWGALSIIVLKDLSIYEIASTRDSGLTSMGSVYWWLLARSVPAAYAIVSIISLRNMNALYDSHYTGNEYHYTYWIKLLSFGFLAQWLLALGIHVAGQSLPSETANSLGKVSDFLGLILVNGLLVYAFTMIRTLTPILGSDKPSPHLEPTAALTQNSKPTLSHHVSSPSAALNKTAHNANSASTPHYLSPTISAQHQQPKHTKTPSMIAHQISSPDYRPTLATPPTEECDSVAIALILKAIEEDKIYLSHTLNLEKLAVALSLPAKEVSRLINTYFQHSFSEFINAYRTLEAERILSDPEHKETPILEVIYLSGFNSKSAFHRFFKRFTGMSPSEYKNQLAKRNDTLVVPKKSGTHNL
ncbi:helix-turn-helix domain-containing protein [Marinagarivorans algicola]|uniref:helix-turn-helix domain-containing protein n=1 Tax=Marinagarivorans algicola TaxID=1513270 RepID=UPI0006B997E2|nr:AraC family transcriptional regulator [Marinagarivorans algicola]